MEISVNKKADFQKPKGGASNDACIKEKWWIEI